MAAVDEEFEVVSAQLLRRTQAMLNKYRLLLLEESRVSPFFGAGRGGFGRRRRERERRQPGRWGMRRGKRWGIRGRGDV